MHIKMKTVGISSTAILLYIYWIIFVYSDWQIVYEKVCIMYNIILLYLE